MLGVPPSAKTLGSRCGLHGLLAKPQTRREHVYPRRNHRRHRDHRSADLALLREIGCDSSVGPPQPKTTVAIGTAIAYTMGEGSEL